MGAVDSLYRALEGDATPPGPRPVDPAGWVDRGALRVMEAVYLSGHSPDLGDVRGLVDDLTARYAAPEHLARPETLFGSTPPRPEPRVRRLGRVPGGERLGLTFPSPFQPRDPDLTPRFDKFGANRTCRARLWRHGDRPRATVLALHGWSGGYLRLEERILAARTFYRLGLDVALVTLPFHGRRTPGRAVVSGRLWPNRDLRLANEGFLQAVSDVRATLAWLRAERPGVPIGLLGLSLGGAVAALLATLEPELAFVVAAMAPASVADTLWQHGARSPGRREAEAAGFTLGDFRAVFAGHCPLSRPLLVPRERAFVLGGRADRIVPPPQVDALWERWGRPALHWIAGGHLLQLGRRGALRAITAWLDPLLPPA